MRIDFLHRTFGVFAALSCVVILGACSSFLGATLPPGAAGGAFSKNPKGLPKMSRVMYGHQLDLNSAATQKLQMQYRVLRLLDITSRDFRKQFSRQATTWKSKFTDFSRIKTNDIDLVMEGAHWAVELDALLFSVWKDYRNYLPYGSEPDIYAPSSGANLLDKATRMKGGVLVLAAELLRMDNTRVLIETSQSVPLVAYLMNRGDDKFGVPGESFDRMIGQYFEPDRRLILRKFLLDVEFSRHELNSIAAKDTELAFALSIIQQSQAGSLLKKENAFARQRNYSIVVMQRTWASFLTPTYNWQLRAALSKKKKKKKEKMKTVAEIKGAAESFYDHLKPMDVILIGEEKRVTKGEKERFDHAVIYLGSFRDVARMGFAEHKAMSLYGGDLRRGHTFLELAGSGIKLWEIDDMLQVNELVVLRYAKNRLVEATLPINENEDNEEGPDAEAAEQLTIENEETSGFNRPSIELVQDVNIGNLGQVASEEASWRDYAQRDVQVKSLTQRTLDLMIKPEFVSPPSLNDLERSSLLLSSVFGMKGLGVSLRAGQNVASLKQMLTAAVVISDVAEIPFTVLKGDFRAEGAAKGMLIKSMAEMN